MKVYKYIERITSNTFILFITPTIAIEKHYEELWFSFNWFNLTLNIVFGEK